MKDKDKGVIRVINKDKSNKKGSKNNKNVNEKIKAKKGNGSETATVAGKSSKFKIISALLFSLLILMIIAVLILRPKSAVVPNKLILESEVSGISNNTLSLSDGSKMKLPTNVEEIFNDSEKLREELDSSGKSYKHKTRVKEYYDRVVIEDETVIEGPPATNSNESGNESNENESESGTNTNSSGLSGEQIEGAVDEFLGRCVGNKNPLCRMGKDGLLDLLKNKSETNANDSKYVITDRLQIRKIPRFDFENILRDKPLLQDPESVFVPKIMVDMKPWTPQNGSIVVVSEFLPLQSAGMAWYDDILIDGFTLGYEMTYEKNQDWKVLGRTVAETSVGAYAGFGVGVRLPFKVVAGMPSLLNSEKPWFNTTVSITPLNLDKDGYRKAGVGEHQLFDGKELVLKVGAEVFMNAKVLGVSVADEQIGRIIDNSKDFHPPMKDEQLDLGTIVFHGYDTGLFEGSEDAYVEGNIGIGAAIKGDKFTLDVEPVNVEGAPDKLVFKDSLTKTFRAKANAPAESEDDYGKYGKFGFGFTHPRYYPLLALILKMNVAANVDTGDVLGVVTVETPWIDLYEFDLPLPYLTRHPGTTRGVYADKNKEYIIVHSWDDVLEHMGTLFVNSTEVCNALQRLIPVGTEVEELNNAQLNIRTFENEPIGSVRIEEGSVSDVSCKHKFVAPTHSVYLKSYQTLFDMNKAANRGANFYDLFLDGIRNGNVRIEGEGASGFLASIATIGLKLFPGGDKSINPQPEPPGFSK